MNVRQTVPPKGIATAIVLVVLFVITVLGFALGSRGTMALQLSYISRQQMQAYYAAQAGIMLAIEAEVNSDANLPTVCGQTVTPSSLLGINIGSSNLLANNTYYTLSMTNNAGAVKTPCPLNPAVTAPDGTTVPAGYVYITSAGYAPSPGRGQVKKVSNVMLPVTLGTPGTLGADFNYAVFSQISTALNNNTVVDSYNSSYGSYNCSCGGSNCTCSSGYNVGSSGNIGTNSKANASVTLSNNTNIKGEVDVGPGGTAGSPTISASNNATYSKAAVLSSAMTFPTVTDPVLGSPGGSDYTCADNATCNLSPAPTLYNNISLGNNSTLNIPCGNYSMNSFQANNTSTINITCTGSGTSASLYVHGTNAPSSNPISFGNNAKLIISGVPGNFQVYDLSSATSCGGSRCTDTVANNGTLYMAFYAQNSNVTVANNGLIYGSVIGYSINLSNNNLVHYDQALSNVLIGGSSPSTPAVVGNFTVWNFQ